jgi:hypothetical protein
LDIMEFQWWVETAGDLSPHMARTSGLGHPMREATVKFTKRPERPCAGGSSE